MRILIIIGIVLAIFGPFTVVAFRLLTRLHPRRRPIVMALAIVCNLMWLFLPLLNARTDFSRLIRAILGPPWFAWLCFVILYSLVIAIVLLAWIPFHKRTTFDDFARRPSRAFLWFVLIGGVIGVYQALVPLRVEHVPVRMPAGVAGKKLVLIADLHTGLFTRTSRLETIFRTAAAQHPDAIVLAGDLIDDDPYFTPKLIAATQVVPPSIPILATLGNHETYGAPFEHIAKLRGSHIRLLVNEGFPLGRLWIAGLSDYAALQNLPQLAPDFDAALRGKPADAVPIVVAHQPRAFPEAKRRGIALTLAAHTHGGQCGIRPLHLTLAGLFVKYDMGLYREGRSQLYVNTGTGYWLLPFRLGLTPEITVIELSN